MMNHKYSKYLELFKKNTPFFLINEFKLESIANAFVSSFKSVYKNTEICYSLKTNYLPWVANKYFKLNILPEVISGFELDICKLIGINQPIIVNGPCKSYEELTYCIKNKFFINVDNATELDKIISISEELDTNARIGIRLRPPGETWKRFGVEYLSSSWEYFLKQIKNNNNLQFYGLHMHIGTDIIEVKKYVDAAKFMLKVAENIDQPLKYIDMGGGFATQTARLNNYDQAEWIVPSYIDYSQSIFNILKSYLLKYDCKLIYEPGRALIDEPIDIYSKIINVTENRIIIDAGKNIIPSVQFRNHPIELISDNNISDNNSNNQITNYDIFGPLCMGSDCIGKNIKLSNPKENDIIRIKSVGAYCHSQSMNFIKYQPETFIESNGEIKLVRSKQNCSKLFALDTF